MAYDRTHKEIYEAVRLDYPQIFKELSDKISPLEVDTSKIDFMHDNFISVFESTSRMATRLKFVCIVLHIYSPSTLYYGISCDRGVSEQLQNIFNYKERSAVSRIISRAREKMKREFFRNEVLTLIKIIS